MIGRLVRRSLGRLEKPIARLYRNFFFRCDAFASMVRRECSPSSILEIGCGEGLLIESLAAEFPGVSIIGIDIDSQVGRLFQGDRRQVVFIHKTIEEYVAEHTTTCDLAVICDVMHHIPWEKHRGFLAAARGTIRTGGVLIVKDWERTCGPVHLLGWISDRIISGQRVRFGTRADFRRLLREVFGNSNIIYECSIPPWRNNMAFFVRID